MNVDDIIAAFEHGVPGTLVPHYLRELEIYGAHLQDYDAGSVNKQYSGQAAWEIRFSPRRVFHVKQGPRNIWHRWSEPVTDARYKGADMVADHRQ